MPQIVDVIANGNARYKRNEWEYVFIADIIDLWNLIRNKIIYLIYIKKINSYINTCINSLYIPDTVTTKLYAYNIWKRTSKIIKKFSTLICLLLW